MTAWMEATMDERLGRKKTPSLPGCFEPLHLPLSSSGWPMRVLGPIFQISALPMLDARKRLSLSDTMALQLVGHDDARLIPQTLQRALEEALCGIGVTPWLNQDVEHNPILVDRAPERVLNV